MSKPGIVATQATADALELSTLLTLVAELAASDGGARRAEALAPADAIDLERRRGRYDEVARLVEERPLVPSLDAPVEPIRCRSGLRSSSPPSSSVR